jgi:predicted DNA-binding protein (UPF0251 family)
MTESEMKDRMDTPRDNFTPAVEAIDNLLSQDLHEVFYAGGMDALSAHAEIELVPIEQKSGVFYRNFLPLLNNLVSVLTGSYRRYFKLTLVHPQRTGREDQWAWEKLEPAVGAALKWIRNWYVLACDVQPLASTEFVPGQTVSVSIPTVAPPLPPPESWRAPNWLFQVSPYCGTGPLKTKHVPARDSEQRLGAAHTRLLLRGVRRTFLLQLGNVIETVRNEEVAAAGAMLVGTLSGQARETKKVPKHWLKGFEGLGPKVADLSRYTHVLTEKQQIAFSLKGEYGLKLAEVASRMGLDRKTAYEHLKAADKKINEAYSNDRRKARSAKVSVE